MKELVQGSPEYNELKAEALALFGVVATENFDVKLAIRQRIDYLKQKLRNTEMRGFVLGISGGVDSTAAGRLCQLACEELRAENYFAQFIAERLPAGVQIDEADAQAAIKFINADKTITVNVGPASDSLSEQGVKGFTELEGNILTAEKIDFNRGNISCRLRMASQYQLAAFYNALVMGTDHSVEAVCAFFCKWGDSGVDLLVLNGLNKAQVRLVAKELGAPESLWAKPAMAGLEALNPKKTDEASLGIPYPVLDTFLERKEVDKEMEYKIVYQFLITQHKRQPIPGFEPQ
jgi:NAD+ synthase